MRDQRAQSRRPWRPIKRRWKLRLLRGRKVFILAILLLLQLVCFLAYTWHSRTVPYGREGPVVDSEGQRIVFPGETEPRHSDDITVITSLQTYTHAELEKKYANMDFVYTFVNGTEPNHAYRRSVLRKCSETIKRLEEEYYENGTFTQPFCSGVNMLPRAKTNADILRIVHGTVAKSSSTRDRERDELRYSIRSVEQHMRWHTGRLMLVSPGHNPYWVHRPNNFMLSACISNNKEELRGRHNRITTIHQDAIMPYGLRLTVDSHTIEMQLFRLRNMTPIHVFLNDDYFINRDVKVADLLNEYGGTYVRTERGMLQKAIRADNGSSWIGGVWHTNLFNVVELDVNAHNHLPSNLTDRWKDAGYDAEQKIPVPGTEAYIHTARRYKPEILPQKASAKRPRFFATHAPFVYCTRMFEYLNTRYEREIAYNTLHNRGRRANDLFTPFVYNAFIMARPWQSSPRFLPYLNAVKMSREQGKELPSPLKLALDNNDACAPATLLRRPASEAAFAKFVDDIERNKKSIQDLKERNPLFFNINDGFSAPNSTSQLQDFLANLFFQPVRVERSTESNIQEDYEEVYKSLMELPIVIFASYSEAFCPLVRSLQLALPDHEGMILLVRDTQLDKEGESDDLAAVRKRVNHRVMSAVPVTQCTYNSKVQQITLGEWRTLGEEVLDAIDSLKANKDISVPLPGDYIGGSDVRVAAISIDARTRHPLDTIQAVSHAIQVPGQTIALEDFVPFPLSEGGESFLLLSLEDANRKVVHWVHGASETDLLLTFPLPVPAYEDLEAKVKWSA
ncbi:putative ATP-dependent chaperone [Trypanosoma theileri]|uniref:Putative ATP-dependent chaperone n=1 Tax=Trypanosoma theileri TaxID=67003 RepID=A0A1X0NYY7_9TRYP|nr:putative ATP-dependent chaperone [Trypanosoma theileri]ORC89907.1 putative ATP-dependent chaperone [Trypanosoma theileri]